VIVKSEVPYEQAVKTPWYFVVKEEDDT